MTKYTAGAFVPSPSGSPSPGWIESICIATVALAMSCPTSIANPAAIPFAGGMGPEKIPVVLSIDGTGAVGSSVCPPGDRIAVVPPPPASCPDPLRGVTVLGGSRPSSEVAPGPTDFTELASNAATV